MERADRLGTAEAILIGSQVLLIPLVRHLRASVAWLVVSLLAISIAMFIARSRTIRVLVGIAMLTGLGYLTWLTYQY